MAFNSPDVNYLIGTDPKKIIKAVFEIIDGKGKKGEILPLWDGKAGQRVVEILANKMGSSNR